MARPTKNRRICGLPFCTSFSPDSTELQSGGNDDPVILNLDEFETIRLIDYEERDQKTCAEQMNVARTTVQAIYESARAKIAECLIEGRSLKIEGGNYAVCTSSAGISGCSEEKRCCRRNVSAPVSGNYTIAATYEDGNVFQHFGQTNCFKSYTIEGNRIVSSELIPCGGRGRGTLAGYLRTMGVSVLICGGIGLGARNALRSSGILVCSGVTGSVDERVLEFLAGKIQNGPCSDQRPCSL